MPCNDGRDARIVYVENLEKVDQLTRMLCSLCRAVDSYNSEYRDVTIIHMPNNVRDWWKQHKEADEKREEAARKRAETMKKKKKLRRSGLSKLTDEERTVLGLQKRR